MAKKTAAQQLEKVDGMMRIILADLADNASRLNEWWSEASAAIRSDPDRALESLMEAEIHLETHVRIERQDALREIRKLTGLLGRELDGDEQAAT